jgi:hypothetical protein
LACSLLTAALWPALDVPPPLAVFELLLDPQAATASEAAASRAARNTRRTSYLLCGLLDPRRARLVLDGARGAEYRAARLQLPDGLLTELVR